MKKLISIALAAVLALSLVACGNSDSLSGKVATDGSTSMEKVIGALKETFEGENKGVEVTYNPTGSSAGITAVASEMSYADGLQRQALFSIALVLFLFIMFLNGVLNFFLKGERK